MKIHITNLYNFNKNDNLVKKQHFLAEAGHSLGFHEMGIFAYPVETDKDGELSKRLDAIIAALECRDIVFLQLPTENGKKYEQRLIEKIKAYRNTKLILILHEEAYKCETGELYEEYRCLCELADVAVDVRCMAGVSLQKILLDAVSEMCTTELLDGERVTPPIEEEMQIGFGLHDKTGNYSVYVGIVMQSIIENTRSPICFHVLHDETLSESNREKLALTAQNRGHRIRFHFLDRTIFDDVAKMTERFTIGAMFRVMLPILLPDVSRIIYLDADILVNRDMKELWDMDIREYCLAAVQDGVKKIGEKNYFNSGVLYMNLDRIRETGNMKDEVLNYLARDKQSGFPDQDALNVIYEKSTLFIDESWNYLTILLQQNGEQEPQKKIYHYAGMRSILYSRVATDRLYYEIIRKTPWGKEECNRQLDMCFGRLCDKNMQLEKVLLQVSDSNKKKIFYGPEFYAMKNMYAFLSPKAGDYQISEYKEFLELQIEKEDFIIFVHPDAENGKAIENLEKSGLENGRDFFVISRLLPPEKGGYM